MLAPIDFFHKKRLSLLAEQRGLAESIDSCSDDGLIMIAEKRAMMRRRAGCRQRIAQIDARVAFLERANITLCGLLTLCLLVVVPWPFGVSLGPISFIGIGGFLAIWLVSILSSVFSLRSLLLTTLSVNHCLLMSVLYLLAKRFLPAFLAGNESYTIALIVLVTGPAMGMYERAFPARFGLRPS